MPVNGTIIKEYDTYLIFEQTTIISIGKKKKKISNNIRTTPRCDRTTDQIKKKKKNSGRDVSVEALYGTSETLNGERSV